MSEQRVVETIRCHGAGNTFFILDESREELIPDPLKGSFARLVCDRGHGIGSDGIVFVSTHDADRPRMRFFNPDGSEAEMCGNGLRCASRACFEAGYRGRNPLVFKTLAGDFKTENFVSPLYQLPFVRVTTDAISTNPARMLASRSSTPFIAQPLLVGGQAWVGTMISIGNPHLIVPVADLHTLDLMALGHAMEHHPIFLNRANISFVQLVDRQTILVQTYERGAGLTLSCGTGMIASVVAQVLDGAVDNNQPVAVHTAGGIVWVTPRVTETAITADLTGNASWVYKGKIRLLIGEERIQFATQTKIEKEQFYPEEASNYEKLARQSLFDRSILRGTPLEQSVTLS